MRMVLVTAPRASLLVDACGEAWEYPLSRETALRLSDALLGADGRTPLPDLLVRTHPGGARLTGPLGAVLEMGPAERAEAGLSLRARQGQDRPSQPRYPGRS